MTAAWTAYRKAAHLRRGSPVGDDPARVVAPHPWLIATAKQRFDALSAHPAVPARPASAAQSTIPTMPDAAKSP